MIFIKLEDNPDLHAVGYNIKPALLNKDESDHIIRAGVLFYANGEVELPKEFNTLMVLARFLSLTQMNRSEKSIVTLCNGEYYACTGFSIMGTQYLLGMLKYNEPQDSTEKHSIQAHFNVADCQEPQINLTKNISLN